MFRTIAEDHGTARIFTVCRGTGELHHVPRRYGQFTAGRWSTACHWTLIRQKARVDQREPARRRADNAVLVTAALGKDQA